MLHGMVFVYKKYKARTNYTYVPKWKRYVPGERERKKKIVSYLLPSLRETKQQERNTSNGGKGWKREQKEERERV